MIFGPRAFPVAALVYALCVISGASQIRDGGIDPANLGKGDWIYAIRDATNNLGGHVASVTNENSLMLFYKSQGIRYVMVKTGTGATLYNGCYAFPQLTTNFINTAHTNGIWVFGYNRSYGTNVAGEVAIADFVFNQGADGFVWDAEAEWESAALGPQGPALAWQQCSQVRSNWPNKFLAHAPFPIIYFHASFPYKEFGFWCDAVMPQIYHLSSAGLKGSPSATINWTDVNWTTWQNSLASLPVGTSNGVTVNWTNAIKPIIPLQDAYGPTIAGGLLCNSTSAAQPDRDVMEFIDYAVADPNAATSGGYRAANFWRADLHGAVQWDNIRAGTIGNFAGLVNNIVLDDRRATFVGGWTSVRVFGATTTLPTYYGATGSDTNSFGTNYSSKAQGSGAAYAQFSPNIQATGNYDVYEWHPYVTNASAGTPFVINHAGGTTTVFANQQTNSGNWSLLGRFLFNAGTNHTIRILDNFADANGRAIVDGLKLVFASTSSAPVIVSAPQSLTNLAGQDANFSVTAIGTQPLTYQWRFNSTNIPGAANASYTRSTVQPNDAGTFTVIVSNALGVVTSAPALLTVNYSLNIAATAGGTVTAHPNLASQPPGSIVTLTAAPNSGYTFSGWSGDASGTNNPLSVTMTTNKSVTANFLSTLTDLFLDNTNEEVTFSGSWTSGSSSVDKYLADYRFANGAVTETATATYRPAIGIAGYYDVLIWYPQGSNRATNAPWSVAFDGGTINVAVDQTVNGGGWRMLATTVPFASGTNGFVRLSNNLGYTGKVVLADGVRFTFVAPPITPPIIQNQPLSQSVRVGSNVTFTVAATGTAPLNYQWRFNATNLPAATNANYTRLNTQQADAGLYSVSIANSAGSVTSSNAVLTVNPWSPVEFLTVARLPDGRVQLEISGEANALLWIDRSFALPATWLELTNLLNTSGTVNFIDNDATNHGQLLYRARQ